MSVDERGAHRGPDGQLEVQRDRRPDQRDRARRDEPRPAHDPRLDREEVEGDPRRQEDRQGVVAEHDPEQDGRRNEPAIRPCGTRPAPLLPAHQEDEEPGQEGQVQRVGIGKRAHPPRQRRERQQQPGCHCHARPPRQLAHEDDRQAGRHAEQDRGQEVHPQGELAERREDERDEPAEDHVGRKAGRVGHPEDRGHGLELPGVPEALAGQEDAARQDERHDPDEQGRDGVEQRDGRPAAPRGRRVQGGGGQAEARGGAHQPSVRAQAMPHACIATDAPTRPATTASRHGRDAPRGPRKCSVPSAIATSRNGAKSRLKR